MPPIETEPIESDSDEAVHYTDVPPPEIPSRTPPRHHHHHRRHHRHHQNHHRESEESHEMIELDRESSKDRRINNTPPHPASTTPVQVFPSHDEDSRMSLVSDSDKISGSKFTISSI